MPLSERKSRRQKTKGKTIRSTSQPPSPNHSQRLSDEVLSNYIQFGQEIQQVRDNLEASYQHVEDRLDELEQDFSND